MINKDDLKKLIIETVNDPDINNNTLKDESPLIGPDGIFFDSIDVLELIVQLEKKFGIQIKDNDMIQEKLKSFNTLFDFVNSNAK